LGLKHGATAYGEGSVAMAADRLPCWNAGRKVNESNAEGRRRSGAEPRRGSVLQSVDSYDEQSTERDPVTVSHRKIDSNDLFVSAG
jgi:hypothetical protein